jgi:DNA-directed RNA polymerase specialized sigma24 family protein
MRREQTVRIMEVLGVLPPAQRAAIVLRYLQGRSVPEVAGILGRSTSATEGLLKRGVRNLRAMLKGRSALDGGIPHS